jgi:membrane protein
VRLTLTPIRNLLRPKRPTSRPVPAEPTQPPEPVYTLPAAPPEPIRIKKPGDPQPAAVAAATEAVGKVMGNKLVSRVITVLDIYGNAAGGLFAAALAYATMFALIPLVLLVAGLLGWLIDDPTQRQELLNRLIGYFPPLASFFSASLNGLVQARGALSIIGIVGLIWGASNFYAGLDEVMRRIFPGGNIRGPIDRRVRGIITIVLLLLLLIATVVLSSIWSIINSYFPDLAVIGVAGPVLGLAVFIVGVLFVFVLVPTAPPTLRAALPPAVVSGLGIGLLTTLFGVLAPFLVGSLSGLGVVATAFALLIWLNFSYQILLYGAAWARLRRDRAKDRASVFELAG